MSRLARANPGIVGLSLGNGFAGRVIGWITAAQKEGAGQMTGWMPVRLRSDASAAGPRTPELLMGAGLLLSLGLASGGTYRVAAGGEVCRALVKSSPGADDVDLAASASLLSRLRIGPTPRAGIIRGKGGEVRLGPVIAILVDPRVAPRPFGEQTGLVRSLISAAHTRGYFAYALTPSDALKSSLWAYGLTGDSWVRQRVPAPDVCYDRCSAVTHAQLNLISRAKSSLVRRGSVLFNSKVGSKEHVYRLLKSYPNIVAYLPETRRASRLSLVDMLRRHKIVYVKPSWGTQGRSIVRVAQCPGGYSAASVKAGGIVRVRARTASGIAARIGLPRSRPMLVQQGIDLISVGARLADIRVLVQKTGTGEWEVTGCAARVGREGSPVSNLHQGGGVATCPSLLNTALRSKDRAEQVEGVVHKAALEVASALEREGGTLGELGIDIGVDKRGKVWFIEANPRPGRSVLKHIGAPGIRSLSITRPMEFAAHLAAMKHTRREQQDVDATHGSD